MHQFKHTFKQLSKKAVLFLAFAMLLTVTVATAISASDSNPVVNFTFSEEECTVTLSYPGLEKPIVLQSGKDSDPIPYGSEVTVTVTPALGYKLKDIWNLDDPGKSIKNPYDNTYYTSSFLASVRAEIECVTSVFDVKFEKADVTNLPYKTQSGDMAEFSGLQYYYKQAGQLTVLPIVVRDGYTFQYWQVIKSDGTEVQKIMEVNDDGYYYIPSTIINEDMVQNGTIYLHAEFAPDPQPVIRYDQAYDTAIGQPIKMLGSYKLWTAPMDMIVSALTQMGDDMASDDSENPYLNYKGYAGYRLVTDPGRYTPQAITKPTDVKPEPNVFYRYYEAITYTLVYENLADGTLPDNAPETYTYDTPTEILKPARKGYTFMGWQVTVDGVVVDECTADEFILGNLIQGNEKYAAKDEKIHLSAVWQANVYDIDYDWSVTDSTLWDSLDDLNDNLPQSFVFNSDAPIGTVEIPNPKRNGYSFVKWILHYVDDAGVAQSTEAIPVDGKYTFASDAYACEEGITLTAVWQANKYTVSLNGVGAPEGFTTEIRDVEFDQPLVIPTTGFVLPTRIGFDFDGYWSAEEGGAKYINADGTANCTVWDLYQDADGVITLYARWIRKSYPVIIDISGIPAGVSGLVIEIITADRTYVYGAETILLPFETAFTVRITAPDGYKTVQWNGTAVDHTALYTSDAITVEAKDVELSVKILPRATVPAVNVDYIKEHFLLSNGSYRIYLDPSDPMFAQVNGGAVTVNGKGEKAVKIPNAFFGQTVSIVYLGNGEYADSDPITLTLAARPAVPKYNDEIHSIDNTYDTQIRVNMLEACAGLYEYAIALLPDASLLPESDWKQSQTHFYLFEQLQPGTTYYVFIRRAATETTPHGEVYSQSTATLITKYLPGVIDRLNGMLGEDDGDLTRELVQNAIDQITQWSKDENGLPSSFYLDVEALLAEVEAKIAFTRLQDSRIAQLESFRDALVATGSLSGNNTTLINTLCAGGVADITAAESNDQVEEIFRVTMAEMEIVPFSYLFDADRVLQLFSSMGLNQDSSLTWRRFEDMEALRRAVNEAVRTSGRVVVNSFMKLEDLREMEVVDGYRFGLINALVQSGDSFIVRMLIPDSLKGKTGLQVAYYNEATGMLELLKTSVDGDELVFEASEIADFVILAEPVINLTALIVALGVIMLGQLVAIAVILISRIKGNRLIKHASTVLPTVFLTVHFSPLNADRIVLWMGAGVILLQVVLMWLLLNSDIVRFRKRGGGYTSAQDNLSYQEERSNAEEAYASIDDAIEEEPAYEGGDVVEDTAYETEEAFEEDEFIEPAANPYYSLPDDEEATFEYDADADAEESADELGYGEDVDAFAVFEADAEEADSEEEYAEEAYAEDEQALYDEDAEQVDAYAYAEEGEADFEEAEYSEEEYATDEELACDEEELVYDEEAFAYDEEQEETAYADEDAPAEDAEEVTDEDTAFYRYDE